VAGDGKAFGGGGQLERSGSFGGLTLPRREAAVASAGAVRMGE